MGRLGSWAASKVEVDVAVAARRVPSRNAYDYIIVYRGIGIGEEHG